MYLAYLDDSVTKQNGTRFLVLTAVLIQDRHFHNAEVHAGIVAQGLNADAGVANFEEFKACELFGGYGPFEKVDTAIRHHVLEWLLGLVPHFQMPVIYSAVDQDRLSTKSYASASPLDMAFRNCMFAIESHMQKTSSDDLVLLISDEFKKDRSILKSSFKSIRGQQPSLEAGKCGHFHDDMYFGDSKDSIGIQLADVCGYFIAKHLEGHASGEGFYQIFKNQIAYCKIEPD